jgi:hypothetical protein
MTTLLRLLFLAPLGFVLAMLAAGLTVSVGVVGIEPTGDAVPWIPLFAVWTGVYAGGFAFIPWIVAVVIAEGFALRSVFLWLALGGAVGAAAYLLTDVAVGTPWSGFNLAFHLAAGFVAGFVYWLVAGRQAGAGLGRQAARPTERSTPGRGP